jgi:predicted ATPase
MRSIDDLALDLTDTTVLIGPNGAGKSTIIEACELLRMAGSERPFVTRALETHGGRAALVRHDAKRLQLGVTLTTERGIELGYDVSLRQVNSWLAVERETAFMTEPGKARRLLLERDGANYSLPPPDVPATPHSLGEDDVALAAAAFQSPELQAIRAALASIEVHTAPETRPVWTTSSSDTGMRASNVVRPVTRVEAGGRNLANVYRALRDQRDWPDTLARIQLGLGDRVEAVTGPVDPSGGRMGLALRIAGVGEVPAFAMSEGQLAYLSLVAVLRLQRPRAPSLVAFDEPDLHLHPGLVRRLMADLEVFGRRTPVLVATQSDAMLDALTEPASCAVLCDLNEQSATRCVRPDAEELQRWLASYRGLGELRSAGYEELVFPALEAR